MDGTFFYINIHFFYFLLWIKHLILCAVCVIIREKVAFCPLYCKLFKPGPYWSLKGEGSLKGRARSADVLLCASVSVQHAPKPSKHAPTPRFTDVSGRAPSDHYCRLLLLCKVSLGGACRSGGCAAGARRQKRGGGRDLRGRGSAGWIMARIVGFSCVFFIITCTFPHDPKYAGVCGGRGEPTAAFHSE